MDPFHEDYVLDGSIERAATAERAVYVSAKPANYAGLAAVTLISRTVTPGIGGGDFTKANGDVSGRKLTLAAKTGMIPSANGTITGVILVDDTNTRLLSGTAMSSQAVTTSQVWDVNAVDFEFRDPTV